MHAISQCACPQAAYPAMFARGCQMQQAIVWRQQNPWTIFSKRSGAQLFEKHKLFCRQCAVRASVARSAYVACQAQQTPKQRASTKGIRAGVPAAPFPKRARVNCREQPGPTQVSPSNPGERALLLYLQIHERDTPPTRDRTSYGLRFDQK